VGSSALGHLLSAQSGRRLLVGVPFTLFFGVRFTRAANSKSARDYIGLDTYGRKQEESTISNTMSVNE
jgi:hypothetical protein